MNQLVEFFNHNSTYREHFLKHKLFFDAQLEFAKSNQRLLIYEPEYDQDGFDLIFDNLSVQRHIQVKSILKPARTCNWEVHRNLLRPSLQELSSFPVSEDSYGVGYGGGVLLISANLKNDNENIETSYYFSDALIISAILLRILKNKNTKCGDACVRFAQSLFSPYEIGGKVKINKSCFIRFHKLSELFSFCGFSLKNHSGGEVRHLLKKAVEQSCGRANKIDRKVLLQRRKIFAYEALAQIADLSAFIKPEKNSKIIFQ